MKSVAAMPGVLADVPEGPVGFSCIAFINVSLVLLEYICTNLTMYVPATA